MALEAYCSLNLMYDVYWETNNPSSVVLKFIGMTVDL